MRDVLRLGHDGGGGERLNRRLTDRHHMRALAHHAEELHQVIHVIVEPERTVGERHVAGIMPIGDVDVVVGQQGAHRAAQQRGEMARERRDDEHLGLLGIDVLP